MPHKGRTERRRSQRIDLVQRVQVAWHAADGVYVKKEAQTENVSAHGALLRMERGLPVREVVGLRRGRTQNWAIARVTRSDAPQREGWTHIGVELTTPSEAFWGVFTWPGM